MLPITRGPGRATPCCARCGVAGWYVRHDTLARAGRPHHHRRLRRPSS